MSDLPLHPIVVHLPIALSVLVPVVSTGILLAGHRGWLPRHAFLIAVALQLLLIGSGVVALKTGEPDAELAERVVPEAAIETHEEAAEVFVYAAGALGLGFVAVAFLKDRPAAKTLAAIATSGSVAVLWLGYQAGHAGGRLVYECGAASAHIATHAAGASPTRGPSPDAEADADADTD